MIGGSPCQSFSVAGDGSGFGGKSGLFWEFVKAKETLKPKHFFLENVKMKKEWEQVITDALGVEPILIDSKLVSAQKRQRLYWTNIEGVKQPTDLGINTDYIIDDADSFIELPTDFLWMSEDGEHRVRNATKKGYLPVESYDTINLDFPNSKTRRGRVGKKKFNTLNTGCNQGIFLHGRVKKLTALECARLQTVYDSQYDVLAEVMTENQLKHAFGNGWTVDVITHIFKNL